MPVVALLCVLLGLFGCSREPVPHSLDFGEASGSGGSQTPDNGVVTEWLAVFRTATDVQELDADTTMLVKGSRSMQMERVVQAFAVSPPC